MRYTLVIGYLCLATVCSSQTASFVTRSGNKFQLDGRPFFFLGANAYYMMEMAARGDTSTVNDVLRTASQLGMRVMRTWAFFDSSDSLNPAVIQWRPGIFNEHALQALDFVLWRAQQQGIRLILPLVNSWDEYGGMNQYVRWRVQGASANREHIPARYSEKERERIVVGVDRRQYLIAQSAEFGHDVFYTDPVVKEWYKAYISFLMDRVNTFSGISYKNDPTILGWELANEPRSSDRSGRIVVEWADEMSSHIKRLDVNHLVGTGEEGFDSSPAGYSVYAYADQRWLFEGVAGVSFSLNSSLPHIDFASIHLYPESWGLPGSSGNVWISDHIQLAAVLGKPLVVGEFGILAQQSATYDSWLTTTLLDEGGGGMMWQLLDGTRSTNDGYGVQCPESGSVCTVLRNNAEQFNAKSVNGRLTPPASFSLFQNYPNPFNNQTTIAYDLPVDASVTLSLFNVLGEIAITSVRGFQRAGTRKELLEAGWLASGPYFCQVRIQPIAGQEASVSKKLMILK